MNKLKTFQEWVAGRQANYLNEADASKHLRNLIVTQLKLDKVIASDRGEDISLDNLNIGEIKENLANWQLYAKLPEESRQAAEEMLDQPENSRLADLLDILVKQPINIGKVVTQDAPPENSGV